MNSHSKNHYYACLLYYSTERFADKLLHGRSLLVYIHVASYFIQVGIRKSGKNTCEVILNRFIMIVELTT